MRQTILTTQRLTITTWEPEDFADFQALHADPLTMRFFASGPYDQARAASRFADFRLEQAEWGWTKWRVQDSSGRTIGRGGFGLSEEGQPRELGYLLAPELWGQGLATELARALVDWHFAHPDPRLSRDLLAFAHVENGASRRVLEKVGFTPTSERDWQGQPHAFYLFPAD
ncbi:N-acetyltransferase [Deinococcus metallilatus]|uniref:GNAT family N-acetyltransferase n=1 Tax=Deinococcus metallilatus TaxID=1211322 RepID=A0AAJ5JX15_9DEIO|nr:GNAT family N-acetyltransferase [Deinococcus metallilatus]MBB5297255.1 RimJ/RimL family protein N-acetyltransferase [Deinococcus metallilatus]QBY09671.1 N-acetyltransferase [Deinococcus metallilatus]RXJ09043.1 N-acetyltransferase [Deinococcus metallilatus]TLK21298.1 GNAT family N-acetyltransferase [Deinococcus metallilatus]GMA17198.1 N-acetyltransferase [Deinococcus metallilatus]